MTSQKRFNSNEIFYDKTIKRVHFLCRWLDSRGDLRQVWL